MRKARTKGGRRRGNEWLLGPGSQKGRSHHRKGRRPEYRTVFTTFNEGGHRKVHRLVMSLRQKWTKLTSHSSKTTDTLAVEVISHPVSDL